MFASLKLLNELVQLPLQSHPQVAASSQTAPFDVTLIEEILTRQGFEVESKKDYGSGLDSVVVGIIRSAERHPQADKLQVCRVDVGNNTILQIVCGASNARPDLYVAVALPGTVLPGGTTIAVSAVRSVESSGMLCARDELGLSVGDGDPSGIWELDLDQTCGVPGAVLGSRLGTPVMTALGLRDTILDISVTPNRPDALCHMGIARELLVGLRHAGKATEWRAERWLHALAETLSHEAQTLLSATEFLPQSTLTFDPSTHFECRNDLGIPAYFVGISGVTPKPSPGWLRHLLETLEQNSINDVVDLSNLVLLLLGQPSHAFDFDKLGQGSTRVLALRRAHSEEAFLGLDSKARTLHPDDCVVASATHSQGGVHALLGVIGGEDSKVDASTRRMIVEWANPDPVSVRRTSRRIGRKTDSSFQFEKGITRAGRLFATAVFVALLKRMHPGASVVGVCGSRDDFALLSEGCAQGASEPSASGSTKATSPSVGKSARAPESHSRLPRFKWNQESLTALAGRASDGSPLAAWGRQLEILKALGFRFYTLESGELPESLEAATGLVERQLSEALPLTELAVLEPYWRSLDIDGEADLGEEIIRVIGIDSIAGEPITAPLEFRRDDDHLEFFEAVSKTVAHLGYHEVSSFHFMRADDLERLGLTGLEALGAPVRIQNPTLSDEPYMQTTLLPDLLRKIRRNLNFGTPEGRVFHICRTFQNLNAAGKPVLVGASGPAAQNLLASSYAPQLALSYSFEETASERPAETPRLAGALFGLREPKNWNQGTDRKWVIQDLMAQIRDLGLRFGVVFEFRTMSPEDPYAGALHPHKAVSVGVQTPSGSVAPIGWIGQIHPRSLRAFEIESDVFAWELNLAQFFRFRRQGRDRPVAQFRAHRLPLVRRDFSVTLKADLSVAAVEATVRAAFETFVSQESKGTPRCALSDFRVFDVYIGDKIPAGHKSIAFEISVEPFGESLPDTSIQKLSSSIIQHLEQNLSAVLRA